MRGNQHPYTELSIQATAPARSGVYVIDSKQHWIYIGESANIRDRLLDHHSGASTQSSCIDRHNPATFDYELVSGSDARKRRQDELIEAWKPKCNKT